MNSYDARQRRDPDGDGLWDYTIANRRMGTYPVGYCRKTTTCDCYDVLDLRSGPSRGCEKCHGTGSVASEFYCGGHSTPDEARECFARYLLDGWREETYGDWTGCVVCDTPTKRGLTTRPPLGDNYALCNDHRTFECLSDLAPKSVGQIFASY